MKESVVFSLMRKLPEGLSVLFFPSHEELAIVVGFEVGDLKRA